jgi:hypothetical protein
MVTAPAPMPLVKRAALVMKMLPVAAPGAEGNVSRGEQRVAGRM